MKHDIQVGPGTFPEAHLIPLSAARLASAKRAFSVRRVDLDMAAGIVTGTPRAGDVVIADVVSLGHHQRLEDAHGRRATMFEGDSIIVAYGDRYAPDQFEAHVPATLEACELVAGGGIAARMIRKAGKARTPTRIAPLGLLADATGRRLNTRDFALPMPEAQASDPLVIAVIGSSMNSGKTTTMAALARGETLAGRRVAAIKVTGTGSGGDLWSYHDAGAELVLDFTDAGFATSHRLTDHQRENIFELLLARCRARPGLDLVLVEVADGLYLDETERLVRSEIFRRSVDGIVFAGADAMSAIAGAEWLIGHNLPVLAVSGAFTASPISASEAAARSPRPVLDRAQMLNAEITVTELAESRCAA
ncbi:MAG: DUF1611 domain-containing protein [Alphaproteobacteria bacterium]|nr:MAG: DUF1611 domain-containing protein [Alphaproteobacteria bacterium]